jgi:hypothetical protein
MPGNASGDSSAALPGRKNRRLLSTNDNNSLCKLSRQTGILTPEWISVDQSIRDRRAWIVRVKCYLEKPE